MYIFPLLFLNNLSSEQRQSLRRSQHAPDVRTAQMGDGAQGQDVLQCQEVQGAQPPGEA